MIFKPKRMLLLLLNVFLLTACNTLDTSSDCIEQTSLISAATNAKYNENETSEQIDNDYNQSIEANEILNSAIWNTEDDNESASTSTDSSKYVCMKWNLEIDDYLTEQYAPAYLIDSGLYKVAGAAVTGVPQDFYYEYDTPDFALNVAKAESLLNSWNIVFCGEKLGDLLVKSADMYFEKHDESFSLYSERISFEGCIQLHGKLYCELSSYSDNPNLSYGDLVFYPYPQDIISKGFCIIPFSTSMKNNDGNIFAMDTIPLYLGNVDDYPEIKCDSFSESNYLDISLKVKDINLFFAQAQSGESRSTAVIVETVS